ncbi:MAG: hypothetical protein JSW65_08330 [Candidatus Bipolaricaulota bacterium]|nr:MAG: hypothetical protein JSW65_08330 [Candidatus Bipolaricaulota bacterium]
MARDHRPPQGIPLQDNPITARRVLSVWWPLAASWLLMAIEGPAISAVVARLVDPEIHLAAYGGVVFPLSLFVEAPIIMLLAASTALSRDLPSYRKIRSFMHITSAALTVLHALVAFTPLFDAVVVGVIDPPPEVVSPARLGLMIMLPWTWTIAYRRFNQGVLIRHGHSLVVGVGTAIRLAANGTVLAVGYALGSVPGIAVAAGATIAGVCAEALFVALRVRPVLRRQMPATTPGEPSLTLRAFLRFYIPLSLTSLILLGARPIVSAMVSRMPEALASLAVLPVVTSVTFLLRSFGVSYNEVVVALIGRRGSAATLRRFALILGTITSAALMVIAVTPLSRAWFGRVMGLSTELTALARVAVLFALPLPVCSAAQSWYQGTILHGRRTRSVSEAVVIYLGVSTAILAAGIALQTVAGIYFGIAAMSAGEMVRTGWLAWRSRHTRRTLWERDTL